MRKEPETPECKGDRTVDQERGLSEADCGWSGVGEYGAQARKEDGRSVMEGPTSRQTHGTSAAGSNAR